MKLELALMLADEAREKSAESRSLHERALIALADRIALLVPLANDPAVPFPPTSMGEEARRLLRGYPSANLEHG